MTDLRSRMRIYDQAPAPDYWSDVELRASAAPEAARPSRSPRPALLLTAALMTILLISAAIVIGSGGIEVPSPTPSPTSSAPPSPTVSPTASSSPSADFVNRMPTGSGSGGPAGVYGSVVVPNGRPWSTGMHNVVEDPVVENGPGFRQTQITFAAADDCFSGAEGPTPVPVTIAGLGGLYVEPYDDPTVQFSNSGREGGTTGAYALPFGDTLLCVYLSWDAETTAEELDAARQVVDSIRGQPFPRNQDAIEFEFTLPEGWDTG